MKKIIGRKREQEELMRCYESTESEMVVVYGRRRIGKTYLVNQTFSEKGFTLKVTGIHNGDRKMQIENFDQAMREYTGKSDLPHSKRWMDAFATLKSCLNKSKKKGKRVIFFDEMPWMDNRGSDFLSALEWFWNGWANAQGNIMMIICGSATNWIINKLFRDKGGLYNRATSRIYLNPFTLAETEQYLQNEGFDLERYDIAQIYMTMGGVPYYLKQLDSKRSVSENIDICFFKKNGKLWDEFDNLYETLFNNAETYIKVVETLAEKPTGLTREELIHVMQLPDNGKIGKVLKDLENCGFISKYRYFGRKSKTLTYLLSDFYTLFYFRFIKDNYANDEHFWTHTLDNPKRRSWQGYCFEQVVKSHIEQVKRALGIGAILTSHSCWHIEQRDLEDSKLHGSQIDLLIDRRDRAINLCEIKFYSEEYIIQQEYATNIRNKIATFKHATKTTKSIIPTMITTYGVKQNKYSNLIQQEVTLDDLFAQ